MQSALPGPDLERLKTVYKHPAKNVFAPARAGRPPPIPHTPKTSVYTPACSAPVT